MWQREKPGLWIAAIGAMAVAVVALGILQARWLGELQRAEQERVMAGLRRSARLVSDAVDREVAGALRLLFARPVRPGSEPDDDLAARWRESWEERGSNGLVKAFYQVDLEEGQPVLHRFDPEEGVLVKQAWPASWTRLQSLLVGFPRDFRQTFAARGPGAGAGFRGGFGPLLFDQSDSILIVMPRFARRGPQPSPQPIGLRWSMAEMDAQQLARTEIPRIVREQVGEEYQFAIRAVERDSTLFSSTGEPIQGADVIIPLLHSAPGAFRARPPDDEGPAPPPRFRNPGGPPFERAELPGLWELSLRHQAGSVAALVSAAHRRNLWMSFGVLAVMAIALAMVTMNARRASALARQQMEFVAAVSHELRTPIAAIRSAADNLADGIVRDEPQARRYGEMLRQQGRTLGGLVEQVLAFAGIAAHAPPKDPAPTAVSSVVDDALAACAPLIVKSSCTVEKDIDPALPNVLADATWVSLALRNLVQNALVHGGGQWIRVEAKGNGQPSQIQIAVEDRGQGIEAGDLERIFDPFYRGRNALQKAARGAGLGLAIARRIAETYGGTLRAESRVGSGSKFILSLPAVKG